MKQWIGRWLVGISLFASASMADANPHFISPNEVEIGMTGYAKTVVQGAEIEKFNVEVIGFTGGGAGRELVLVQVSGDVVERTGGVVQGMSGSPVYLNGRLLGAIAYGYKFGDATKCMVMPIEDMTDMWNMPDPLNNPERSAIDIKKLKEEKAKKEAEEKAKAEDGEAKADDTSADSTADEQDASDKSGEDTAVTADKDDSVGTADDKQDDKQEADKNGDRPSVDAVEAVPLATPVMVSGFSEGAFQRLKADLAPFNMVPYAANSMEARVTKRDIEPGSSIGAVMMRGDFSIGALGTVTYVEGNKMVAFGHPFLQIGNSNYFLANSEIFTTIDTLETGFKIGATGAPIGLINQDRSAGIAGIVGKLPSTIPMEITVIDRSSGIEKTYSVQTIHNEMLSPAFLTAAFTNAIERTIDRKGAGTATVDFAIEARNLPGDVFERENMYYSTYDISTGAANEFGDMIEQLMNNRFHPIEVMSVKAVVDIDSGLRVAKMLEAVPDTEEVHPGETVNFKVKIRPHRGEDIIEDVPYRVPGDHPGGEQELIFRGGGLPNTTMMEGIEKHRTPEVEKEIEERERKMTFEEILDKIRRKTRNNDIVVEENYDQIFTTFAELKEEGKELPAEKELGVDLLGVKKRIAEESAKSIQRYPTLYIIDNEITANITVVVDGKDKKSKDSKKESVQSGDKKSADKSAKGKKGSDAQDAKKDKDSL